MFIPDCNWSQDPPDTPAVCSDKYLAVLYVMLNKSYVQPRRCFSRGSQFGIFESFMFFPLFSWCVRFVLRGGGGLLSHPQAQRPPFWGFDTSTSQFTLSTEQPKDAAPRFCASPNALAIRPGLVSLSLMDDSVGILAITTHFYTVTSKSPQVQPNSGW